MRAEARSVAMVVRGKVVDESELSRGSVEVRKVVAAALAPIHGSQCGWCMNLGDASSQGADDEVEDTLLVVPHAAVNKLVRVAWVQEGG